MSPFVPDIAKIITFMIPFIMVLTIHEAAHAYVANRLGDPTARFLGRLTMNPMPHMDLWGSIVFPVICLIMPGNFLFGWGKPVPVNDRNLRYPKRDMCLIALAGPASNLLFAVLMSVVFRILIRVVPTYGPPYESVFMLLSMLLQLNIVLFCFNLIPIPPLDGSRILAGILPNQLSYITDTLERYGTMIFFVLLLTGGFRMIAYPIHLIVRILTFGIG